MSVQTGGGRRGIVGRWLARFEAAAPLLRMGFQGVTAVSALSGVLTFAGYREFVLPALAVGAVAMFGLAYAYLELGVFARKNREKLDAGNNFSHPAMRIDDELIGVAVHAAVHGEQPDAETRETIATAVDDAWREHRDGVEVER